MDKVTKLRELNNIIEKVLKAAKAAVMQEIMPFNSLITTQLWAGNECLVQHWENRTTGTKNA